MLFKSQRGVIYIMLQFFLTLRNKISKFQAGSAAIITAIMLPHKTGHCYKPRWSSGAEFYS